MGKETLRYILLYVGVAVVVMIVSYIGVSLYLGVPVVPSQVAQLLPTRIRDAVAPTPTLPPPLPGTGLQSVERLSFPNGSSFYMVRGNFVSPLYREGNAIRGEFVIEEDPYAARIPVIWEPVRGAFTVGTVRGSFSETPEWTTLNAEEVLQMIQPTESAQLSIDYPTNSKRHPDMRYGLDRIINGFWSQDEQFYLSPDSVAVYRPE